YMSATGPRTPPNRIAPASQPHSDLRGTLMLRLPFAVIARQASTTSSPAPDPAYSKPASISGDTAPTRILAIGVLTPNRTADASPYPMPLFMHAPRCAAERRAQACPPALPLPSMASHHCELRSCRANREP